MQHVFISYSRSDAAWVKGLVVRLEERGIATWLDERDVPLTLSWIEEVRDAIAEARLFVNCDSERSRGSANCAIERGLAEEAGKEQCTVHAGGDLPAATASVLTIFKGLHRTAAVRTELTVLARDWDRAGRPRTRLVSARMRRRLKASLRAASPLRGSERAFLAASRARSRRRTAASLFVAALATVAFITIEVVKVAKDRIVNANSAQAAAYTETRAALAEVADEPFQGLAEASTRGGNESADGANVISGALRYPVPDDAFAVPAAASSFASAPVGAIVMVSGPDGQRWGRAADAVNVRGAHPLAAAPPSAVRDPERGLSFHARAGSGELEVLRDGLLWRVITFTGAPSSLTLSPDGRELAVAVGQIVEIAELQTGAIRTVLRGTPGPVRALAWSVDGRRLWALSPSMVVSWAVRDGTVLLDEPAEDFEAVFPGSKPDSAWVIAHDGTLREIDTHTGSTLRRLRVPEQIDSAGGSSDGTVAALSGTRAEWIVPLEGGRTRRLALPGCALGRPLFENPATFQLSCLYGEVLSISVAEGKVTGRLAVPGGGAYALASLPGSGTLLVGNGDGHLLAYGPTGALSQLWYSECGASITRIAASRNGDAIAPVGSGTGVPGCIRRGIRTGGGSFRFDAVDEPSGGSILAETAAFSNSGEVFAYGFSDGTIVLHSTANILPIETITTVDGAIRDMYVDDEDELIVATAGGIVQRIPICDACMSNRALSRVAEARLARALEIGVAKRAPTP
jgi:hypothetical protein